MGCCPRLPGRAATRLASDSARAANDPQASLMFPYSWCRDASREVVGRHRDTVPAEFHRRPVVFKDAFRHRCKPQQRHWVGVDSTDTYGSQEEQIENSTEESRADAVAVGPAAARTVPDPPSSAWCRRKRTRLPAVSVGTANDANPPSPWES